MDETIPKIDKEIDKEILDTMQTPGWEHIKRKVNDFSKDLLNERDYSKIEGLWAKWRYVKDFIDDLEEIKTNIYEK